MFSGTGIQTGRLAGVRNIFIVYLWLFTGIVLGQSFGQNKVQYRDFNWSYISTPHFDIYYYSDKLDLAKFTATVAEEAYEQVSKHLRWTLNKRVSIIVYHSHNDFQQTNVTWEYMVEGIGGVTELFKNRVVIPFEGNYSQFRHVIHHELVHAVINDMVYGGTIQSIISGRVKLRIPLWANEGLAEYLSMNWDTQADMIMRDLSIHERIPTIEELDYYLAYKGGQSVWRFIAEKYGREKIGEIFGAMKKLQHAEKGFERALGMDYEDLTKQWHKYLKKDYWPDVAGRDEIEDIAKRLTDHKEMQNYFNVSPTISPDGSKIAVLTDRSGYADIYLIDAIDGEDIKRLVKGNRSIDFEELKWLQPGISWAPDNRRVVIAAKSGRRDALYLIDIDTKKKQKLSFDLDGLFTAAWSPDGNKIAFVGNTDNASDIYVYDLKTKELTNLTRDIFSDSEPAWSPDGTKIAFVSDRRNYLQPGVGVDSTFDMAEYDYSNKDIYVVDVATGVLQRITNTDYDENYPTWAHTVNKLLYTADRNGVWNLYVYDFNTQMTTALTNVLTGIFQPSLSADDNLLAFSGYSDVGWDIYTINNPLGLTPKEVPLTNYVQNKDKTEEYVTDLRRNKRGVKVPEEEGIADYSGWIFAPEYTHMNEPLADSAPVQDTIPPESSRTESGEFIPRPYITRFTLDFINGYASYNNVFGASGMTMFAFSDILGDNQIFFGTELVLTLENSDYFFSYAYLKQRTDLFFTFFHVADFFGAGSTIGRLRHYGLMTFLSRPFNRFNRLEGGAAYHTIDYRVFTQTIFGEVIEQKEYRQGFSVLIPSISWVYDNSIFGATGPIDGFRENTTFTVSPGWGKTDMQFQTIKIDLRRYFRVGRSYSFATRLMVGHSGGSDAQRFLLGGLPNWILGYGETNGERDQGRFREVILDTSRESMLKDIYFSEYALPVRGYRYMDRFGKNVALANFEFRFPFIRYLAIGFPRGVIGNIQGHAFFDIGAAWDRGAEFRDRALLKEKYSDSNLPAHFSPVIKGIGLGIKFNMGFALLRIDAAWDVRPNGYSKPQYYFSLGPDF